MHHITEKLIGIHMKDLSGCRTFDVVMKDFLAWCGEDFMFGTWGPQDLTELQKNMRVFGMEPLGKGPVRVYDIQKLFSIAYEDQKVRRSLEYAVDYLQIPKDIPFHRAISDAVYTARVFQMIKDPIALQRVSFDTFQLPENHRSEVHVVFDNYAKYISRPFPDKVRQFRLGVRYRPTVKVGCLLIIPVQHLFQNLRVSCIAKCFGRRFYKSRSILLIGQVGDFFIRKLIIHRDKVGMMLLFPTIFKQFAYSAATF